MNLQKSLFSALAALLLLGCAKAPEPVVKPITGTWVNLAWKDVRNKYSNPLDVDMDGAALWRTKVGEWHRMGLEYLILLEVANEGKAYYPSEIMPHIYPEQAGSPVSAILDEAARYGMKVLLSTGWAENQDEDLRRPEIRERQALIMQELARLYGSSPAFWGWYLPVEDCITPVFPKTAVESVNVLVERAHELTPGKKTLISPYGMVYADYDNPEFAENIHALKVDIIAYQDEIGCVREQFPLPRLRENWKKLRKVHEGTSIQMWANCETFAWEVGTNSRASALIPAAYHRLLAQQAAATEGGVSRIVSFMFGGIIEDPSSPYSLGQGALSVEAWRNYMAWKGGDPYWKLVEASIRGTLKGVKGVGCSDARLVDGILGEERPDETIWSVYAPGRSDARLVDGASGSNDARLVDGASGEEKPDEALRLACAPGRSEINVSLPAGTTVSSLALRALDYAPYGILPPERISVHAADGTLLAIRQFTPWSNNRHDAWIDLIDIPCAPAATSSLRIVFDSDHPVYLDELYVNPVAQ